MKVNVLPLLLLALLSFSSIANEVDKMVEFSVTQMKRMGEFKGLSSATGVSEADLEKGFRAALTHCLKNHNMQGDGSELEVCMSREVPSATGLSAAQLDAWEGEGKAQMPSEKLLDEMDLINEKILQLEEKDDLTAADEKEIIKLENKLMQLSKEQRELQMQEMKDIASDFEEYHKQ
ncbi:hypothetical protein [Shewanella woodyi]|uniref:hypothetical protein n=1 Tax=Shewanella woodyi TaxID=60961 RepID=UPI0007F8C557|nr:hypothetical protein [Shewanella woodyi]